MRLFQYNDEFDVSGLATRYDGHLLAYFRCIHGPKVSKEFEESDVATIKLKQRFRLFGLATIILALLALLFAAVEPIMLLPLKKQGLIAESVLLQVALVSAVLGIATAIVGFSGIGVSARKQKWIASRFRTELIRQWTWKMFLEKHQAAVSKSDLKGLEVELEGKFIAWLKETDANLGFLTNNTSNSSGTILGADLASAETGLEQQFFDFYRERRLVRQLRYSEFLTANSGAFATHPLVQLRVLGRLEIACALAIIFAHFLIVLGVVASIPTLLGPPTHLLVVVAALGLLAVKAIESGLQPHESIHRLNNYHRQLSKLLGEFDRATTANGKLKVAHAVEREAVLETSEFIKQVRNAKFIL